ncbi:hypothetical protein [Cytobacillus kochii]
MKEVIYNHEDLLKMLDFNRNKKHGIEQPNCLFGVPGLLTALFQKKG